MDSPVSENKIQIITLNLQLKGKTALVTGSTAGIGFAIAKNLLKEEATVYINGRTEKRIGNALKQLRDAVDGADVHGIAADFSDREQVENLLREVENVDILVNNVGIFETKEFEDISDEDWFKFFEVNVMSGVRLSRHYFPGMLKQNWGRIIFISSESALNIPTEMIHYGATKTMQLGVSRGLALLTKGTNVTVNTILPGPTKSEGIRDFIKGLASREGKTPGEVEKEFFQTARPTSLLQRFSTTEEVANLVTYIASPLSAATNGAALRVDGGVVNTII